MLNYPVTLKSKLRSLKVTGNGTVEYIIHYLLAVELFDVEYYRDLECGLGSLKVIENCTILVYQSCMIYPMVPFPMILSDPSPIFQGHGVIFMPIDAPAYSVRSRRAIYWR